MKNLFLLIALAGIITSCNNMNKTENKSAASEARLQRFYDEVINSHNPNVVDSFCTADFTDHNPSPGHTGKGLDDLKAQFREFFTGMPDVHMSVNMMAAHGDTV